ncbi:hypothetical protein D1013_16015 [Euzebyella marina]|uniref:Uncharacterized protein n=1 Tax=Euzebyella marina TaxID=1761453 RepID=A0A3G2L947_9FLAO|nr:hypothetical protein [Euzebyella marina]AYN68777.1 hypothetical protein D1013_16015 [Euzebyella marina]
MKHLKYILYLFTIGILSSFNTNQSCNYASSNISYVKTEIEKALDMSDLQLSRFHTYKAINAIEKTKLDLEKCGCEYAIDTISEGSEHLKLATKTSTLASTNILLNKALEETKSALESLDEHEGHISVYGNDQLSLNTVNPHGEKKITYEPPSEKLLRQKVDSSLASYRKSLDKVVSTVNCVEARAYANRIFEFCEQQLLKPNLSEGKKYYNLKTKEITAEALTKLGECGK